MKSQLLMIATALSLASCGLSHSDNEEAGVQEAVNFYGGVYKSSVGVIASSKEEDQTGKYFEIELSKSQAFSRYEDNPEMMTSTMAYKFFSHLDKEERDNYSFVRGTLVYDNGEKFQQDYTRNQLETVERKMKVLENVVNVIKSKQFERFRDLANPEDIFTYNKQSLIDGLNRYDSAFGNVTGHEFFGFKFTHADDKPVLSIFALVLRDKENNQLRVYLNPRLDNNQILNLDYKW